MCVGWGGGRGVEWGRDHERTESFAFHSYAVQSSFLSNALLSVADVHSKELINGLLLSLNTPLR